jgi:hypothetical protein
LNSIAFELLNFCLFSVNQRPKQFMKNKLFKHGLTLPIASSLCLKMATIALCLFALFVIIGCASINVTNRERLVTGPIARPATIWVYNFAATAAEVPADSALVGEKDVDTTPQTAKEIAEGMKLGNEMAMDLVAQINAMGMPAQMASIETKPQVNDIVIRGYILSVKQGSVAARVIVGFGAGKSLLSAMVEGFQVTTQGERKLGYGTLDAGGNKSPGMILGVATFLATKNPAGLIINAGVQTYGEASGSDAVTGRAKAIVKDIASVLKQRFTEQGWIN